MVVGIPTTKGLNVFFNSLNLAAEPLMKHMLEFSRLFLKQDFLGYFLSNNIGWALHKYYFFRFGGKISNQGGWNSNQGGWISNYGGRKSNHIGGKISNHW